MDDIAQASLSAESQHSNNILLYHPIACVDDWASEASPTWAIHLGFFIYYIFGVCVTPFFFFFGVRCAQYKVHARCSFAALAPHMPCMLLVMPF